MVTDAQQEKLTEYADRELERALKKPPVRSDYGDNQAGYEAAKAAHENNPFHAQVQAVRAEIAREIADGSMKPDEAEKTLRYRVGFTVRAQEGDTPADPFVGDASNENSIRSRFLRGVRDGAPDPNAQAKQESIMDKILHGEWQSAIKDMLMMIPMIGDTIAAAGKFLMSQLLDSKEQKLTFTQAREHIELERALGGGFGNLGIAADGMQRTTRQAIHAYEHPDQVADLPQTDYVSAYLPSAPATGVGVSVQGSISIAGGVTGGETPPAAPDGMVAPSPSGLPSAAPAPRAATPGSL